MIIQSDDIFPDVSKLPDFLATKQSQNVCVDTSTPPVAAGLITNVCESREVPSSELLGEHLVTKQTTMAEVVEPSLSTHEPSSSVYSRTVAVDKEHNERSRQQGKFDRNLSDQPNPQSVLYVPPSSSYAALFPTAEGLTNSLQPHQMLLTNSSSQNLGHDLQTALMTGATVPTSASGQANALLPTPINIANNIQLQGNQVCIPLQNSSQMFPQIPIINCGILVNQMSKVQPTLPMPVAEHTFRNTQEKLYPIQTWNSLPINNIAVPSGSITSSSIPISQLTGQAVSESPYIITAPSLLPVKTFGLPNNIQQPPQPIIQQHIAPVIGNQHYPTIDQPAASAMHQQQQQQLQSTVCNLLESSTKFNPIVVDTSLPQILPACNAREEEHCNATTSSADFVTKTHIDPTISTGLSQVTNTDVANSVQKLDFSLTCNTTRRPETSATQNTSDTDTKPSTGNAKTTSLSNSSTSSDNCKQLGASDKCKIIDYNLANGKKDDSTSQIISSIDSLSSLSSLYSKFNSSVSCSSAMNETFTAVLKGCPSKSEPSTSRGKISIVCKKVKLPKNNKR